MSPHTTGFHHFLPTKNVEEPDFPPPAANLVLITKADPRAVRHGAKRRNWDGAGVFLVVAIPSIARPASVRLDWEGWDRCQGVELAVFSAKEFMRSFRLFALAEEQAGGRSVEGETKIWAARQQRLRVPSPTAHKAELLPSFSTLPTSRD